MLNPQQEEIVRHHGKPLLVIAGAGSGKTKTLAHKVEFILEELKIPEDRILCITFTNKAANEIKERILKVTGKELKWVGTFHSVANRILKRYFKLDFSIADESDTNTILKSLLRRYGISASELEKVKALISRVKEDLKEISDPSLKELFEEYQQTLRESKLFDFGDLMYELWNGLKENEDIRNKLKEKFRFILVDEYQDTNTVQYEILKLLADRDICVIGDPNQCIYEWRFARPDNVLRFIEDFNPDIKKLEINYRSKGYILLIANAILEKAEEKWKRLIPKLKPARDLGEKPLVRRFKTPEEEAIWIGEEIKKLKSIYNYRDIAILVRASFLTEAFESVFFKLGIPYRIIGSLKFYERAEVKNVIYILRFLINPSDEIAFRRVLNFLFEGISEKLVDKLKPYYQNSWMETLLRFSRTKHIYLFLKELKERTADYPDLIRYISEETPYFSLIMKRYKGNEKERWENLKEFVRIAEEKLKEGYSLEEFLEEITISSEEEEENEDKVNILTVHSAKGLEFPVVFLPRLEEGIFPHKSAQEDKAELEEERRLFYVAITRAKDKLYLSYTKDKERTPSRFLSDIPKNLLNLEYFRKKQKKVSYSVELIPNRKIKPGIMVSHKVFGIGRVLEVEGEKARVDFKGKVKTIHTAFLEPLS